MHPPCSKSFNGDLLTLWMRTDHFYWAEMVFQNSRLTLDFYLSVQNWCTTGPNLSNFLLHLGRRTHLLHRKREGEGLQEFLSEQNFATLYSQSPREQYRLCPVYSSAQNTFGFKMACHLAMNSCKSAHLNWEANYHLTVLRLLLASIDRYYYTIGRYWNNVA